MSTIHRQGMILSARLMGKAGWPPSAVIETAIRAANARYRDMLHAPLQLYFGNELHGMVRNLQGALQIMIMLEEEMLKTGHSKVFKWVILSGKAAISKLGPQNIQLSGADLQLSREKMFELSRGKSWFLPLSGDRHTDQWLLDGWLLFRHFTTAWKPARDKKPLALFLQGHDYKWAADELGIARPQAWKKYNSLNMREYLALRDMLISFSNQVETDG